MPDDRETWRLVLRGLDEVASRPATGSRASPPRSVAAREAIVGELAEGQLSGGTWEQLNVTRAWSVCMRTILSAFYSHPWAWNEIGFGGPAYPRGYMRLGPTRRPRAVRAAGSDRRGPGPRSSARRRTDVIALPQRR